MWFAAMGPPDRYPWIVELVGRLLEGDTATLKLLRTNPFPDEPPAVVRACLYRYRFTSCRAARDGSMVDADAGRDVAPASGARLDGRSHDFGNGCFAKNSHMSSLASTIFVDSPSTAPVTTVKTDRIANRRTISTVPTARHGFVGCTCPFRERRASFRLHCHMSEHVHVHTPHEFTESEAAPSVRSERIMELVATSSWPSRPWGSPGADTRVHAGTESRPSSTRRRTQRADANRAATAGAQDRPRTC